MGDLPHLEVALVLITLSLDPCMLLTVTYHVLWDTSNRYLVKVRVRGVL